MPPRKFIVLDFETASPCDLAEVGAQRYAEDPNTEILCLCFADLATGAKGEWTPTEDSVWLRSLARDPSVGFIAHNAGFEKAIWRHIMVPVFGFPDIPNDRWHDTMAVCAMKAVPMKLEQVLPTLGLDIDKDMVGSRLVRSLSRINKKTGLMPPITPEVRARVVQYCHQDVAAEVALHRRLGFLPQGEKAVWQLDQTINERGVLMDLDYVRACQRVVEGAQRPMLARFQKITGLYSTGQTAKLVGWLADQGTRMPNLQKETVAKVLGSDIDGVEYDEWEDDYVPPILVPEVREVLTIKQVLGSASVKKLNRIPLCVGSDGRARGVVQYHGASTGRWSGRLFQPHNFPRPTEIVKGFAPEEVIATLRTGDYEYVTSVLGDPVEAVVSGLRHAIVSSPDAALVVGDFAGIEARVVLALAGQWDKVALIAGGLDAYIDFAGLVLKRPAETITKLERQMTGKPGVLGCGFGMGKNKLAAKEKIPLEDAAAIIDAYRKEWAPEVPKLWYALERAAVAAVWEGGRHESHGCRYEVEDGWLTCRLPSGRKLWYRNPQPVRRAMPWDKTDIRRGFTYQARKAGQMRTINAYGGLLVENVVQALARDLMVEAMFLCELEGLPVVLTVHDEIISEALLAKAVARVLQQLMEHLSSWAREMRIPVAAETWTGPFYRK